MMGLRDARLQHDFHLDMFGSLYEWDRARAGIVDLTGDDSVPGLIGLDQMGHFGPTACTLVADRVAAASLGGGRPLRIAELGAGFGGAARYVTEELRGQAVAVSCAIAVELVGEHCRLARTISASLGIDDTIVVCADTARLPVRDAAVDLVFITGSMPHFADARAAIAEARRALQPGGMYVATEEVSLRGPAPLSRSFLECHPPGVFFFAEPEERVAQMEDAGFTDIEGVDVTEWATALVRDRSKALDLFYGTAEGIFGVAQTERIARQLQATLHEYERGALVPMVFAARATGPGGRP